MQGRSKDAVVAELGIGQHPAELEATGAHLAEQRQWALLHEDPLRVGAAWPAFLAILRRSHTTGMQSTVHPTYKTKYRVANWPAYNQAFVRRGDVTLWLTSEAIAA